MSLDLYVKSKCPHCQHEHEHRSLNITHNVRGICRHAGCDPWEWQGRLVSSTLADLGTAIASLSRAPENYRHLEPANKWGTVEDTLGFLRDVHQVAEEAPVAAQWEVSA